VMDSPLMGRRRMAAIQELFGTHASCRGAEMLISVAPSLTSVFSSPPALQGLGRRLGTCYTGEQGGHPRALLQCSLQLNSS
jgi:hypothetical protein